MSVSTGLKKCQHHNRPPAPYKIKVNNWKLIDLVIRIELTWVILMPRFSNFLRNLAIHFLHVFIFGNMFPESCIFVAVLVTRSNSFVSLHKLHMDKLEYVSDTACYWHSNERVTLMKHVTKYENTRNFSENFKILEWKLLELTQFLAPNLSIYFNFVQCWGSVVMLTSLN